MLRVRRHAGDGSAAVPAAATATATGGDSDDDDDDDDEGSIVELQYGRFPILHCNRHEVPQQPESRSSSSSSSSSDALLSVGARGVTAVAGVGVSDMTQLEHLHEASLLHNLDRRWFGSNSNNGAKSSRAL